MTGFEISAILIGIVCGNFGAVVVKPFNLGLFWNSIAGALGAGATLYLPPRLGFDLFDQWSYDFLAAAGAGMLVMLVAGGLTALRFRG
jgi:uncharacterized membrane protein YeaQ/YmgE (transglycosylase-associated protein family)